MRAFADTNVLVYALAADDLLRQATARRVLARHVADASLVLSPQVLLETYHVLVRKKRVPPAEALAAVQLLAQQSVVTPGAATALRAMELSAGHGLSIWDAHIVESARLGDCEVLYSEDLQAGRRFGALQVVNPFALQAHEGPAPAFQTKPARRKAGPRAVARRAAAGGV